MKYKLTEQAKQLMLSTCTVDFTPKQGTPNSSGYDLSACIEKEIILLAGETVKIGTGVHIWIDSEPMLDENGTSPTNLKLAGFLMPRSSIKGCMLTNTIGLIDGDYQGEVIASIFNRTEEPITIKPGQSIVQLIYVFTYLPEMELVEEFDAVTTRGEGGFGSTT